MSKIFSTEGEKKANGDFSLLQWGKKKKSYTKMLSLKKNGKKRIYLFVTPTK